MAFGREQSLAVDAGAANAVGGQQTGQIDCLAEDRRRDVAEIGRAGVLKDALIVLERGAALLERRVKPAQLEADAAAVEIGQIAQRVGHRKFVGVGDERRRAGAGAGIAIVGEVGDEPVARQQIELEAAQLAARVEGLLVEHDAARQQRVGVGRQEIEIGDVAIVGVEIVQLRFFRVEMDGLVRLVAPTVGAHSDLVEGAMLGIGEGEVGAQQLRSRAEIHDAAVGVEAAADAGAPAIAEIDRAGEPGFGRGHG